ncbi:hypothetical protein ETAA1_32250 [Urbifossiella limnaea]|uniref:Uncharacterized protein n=1 Tax=Urbifossiella limnaea TaxID=2528023 RepID=A0A517XUV0_9BACT|nr:hypothetical protein ETAA1_32250 [Urbifossiella limnaea]
MSPLTNAAGGRAIPLDPPVHPALPRELEALPPHIRKRPESPWRRSVEDAWDLICQLVQATRLAQSLYTCVLKGQILADADVKFIDDQYSDTCLNEWNRVLRHLAGVRIRQRHATAASPPGQFPVTDLVLANLSVYKLCTDPVAGLRSIDIPVNSLPLPSGVNVPAEDQEDQCLESGWDPAQGVYPLVLQTPADWTAALEQEPGAFDPLCKCFRTDSMRLLLAATQLRNELRLTPSRLIPSPVETVLPAGAALAAGLSPGDAPLPGPGVTSGAERPTAPEEVEAETQLLKVGDTDTVRGRAAVSIGGRHVAEVSEQQAEFLRLLLDAGDDYQEIASLQRGNDVIQGAHSTRMHRTLPPPIRDCLERRGDRGPWRVKSVYRPRH